MILTGFADEAGADLSTQIKATKELGWGYISARGIDGSNIHDLSDEAFAKAVEQLSDADVQIAEFGSLIGTWAKSIETDFDITLAEVERAIPRMQQNASVDSEKSLRDLRMLVSLQLMRTA